ncbi:MAG: lipoate--protein ligase family protein [Nitrospirae bacterium]|nr:lipoate--protein ligase family protein [Nitrospirota bacterium]
MTEWRMIEDRPGEAAWNMAVDEAIAESCRQDLVPPTIRFYTWTRPALTLGYFQKAERDLDQDHCQREGIQIVRRITGGRAVLHGNDLTYCVAAGADSAELPGTIRGSFLEISRGFIEGLHRLGVEADSVRAPAKETGRSPLCFMSASWYEITCKGRKIIGSAQRRWKDGMLQQGSLLLGFDPEAYYKFFRFPDETRREEIIRESRSRVIGLNDLIPTRVTPKTIMMQIATGFEKALGIRLKPAGLTPFEYERAVQLTQTKYTAVSWNGLRHSKILSSG